MIKFKLLLFLCFLGNEFSCFSVIEVLKTILARQDLKDIVDVISTSNEVVVFTENRVIILDPEYNILQESLAPGVSITAISYLESKDLFAIGMDNGEIYICKDIRAPFSVEPVNVSSKPIQSISWSSSGENIVFSVVDKVGIYSIKSYEEEYPAVGEAFVFPSVSSRLKFFEIGEVKQVKWLNDGRILVFSKNRTFIFDSELNEISRILNKNELLAEDYFLTQSGFLLNVYAEQNGELKINQELLNKDIKNITLLKFSPDGQKIVIGTSDGTVKVLGKKGYETNTFDDRTYDYVHQKFSIIGSVKAAYWKNNNELIVAIGSNLFDLKLEVPKYGEVYWIYPETFPEYNKNINPISRDIKPRLVVVVSSDEFNESTDNIIVVTSTTKRGTINQNTAPSKSDIGPVKFGNKWSLIELKRLKSINKNQITNSLLDFTGKYRNVLNKVNVDPNMLKDINKKLNAILI